MPPVFDRYLPSPHPFDIVLSKLIASKHGKVRALARNIMHDHRVSLKREQQFNKFMRLSRNNLIKALKMYHEKNIRSKKKPDYLVAARNANNFVTLDESSDLVTVFDLTGLISSVFPWAKLRRHPLFDDFPDRNRERLDWLDKKFDGRTESQIEAFIEQALLVVQEYSIKNRYQPTWATLWDKFKAITNEPPNRWTETVGVRKAPGELPRHIILLKYKAKEAGKIVRPTQLDAGSYPQHFPSPKQTPVDFGGHPMDLSASTTIGLLPEYIHNQIPYRLEHWQNAERKYGKLSRSQYYPSNAQISRQRQAHFALLCAQYANVPPWMVPNC